MDHLTPEMRSWNMSRIKGKDTQPKVLVRSILHRAGYRFRKNVKTLPGKNVSNDRKHQRELKKLGWKVVTVWMCGIEKNPDRVLEKLEPRLTPCSGPLPLKKMRSPPGKNTPG
jgi:G:T-mismatch repair DNA endonuclease (very short patch repair protein)